MQDAWLESYSLTRVAKSLEMWRAAGIKPDDSKPIRGLDIACGCAIKSFALAQTSPKIHVTCLDSPAVLDVARDLAERMGIASRVTLLPADLSTADLATLSSTLCWSAKSRIISPRAKTAISSAESILP